MSQQITCPRGHTWRLAQETIAADDVPALSCPVCGANCSAEALPPTVAVNQTEVTERTIAAPDSIRGDMPELPGYQLLELLGRGGMGRVYKARHLRLGRTVAVKMILAGLQATPQQLARFQIEAEALAALQHANIVQIFDVGEHNHCPYLALEYADGGTLADSLRGKPLAPQDAAAVAEKLARAMHAAHQRGIVHRDLKPANVLLALCDGQESGSGNLQSAIPKITDFGLAKRLEADQSHTRDGTVLGTPNYMAPEQTTGDPSKIGPLADIYALGVILYEMLTGRPPFKGATTMATLQMVQERNPIAPSSLQPKTPRDLETICLKCLQKDPARRYASALELAEDLRRFRNHEPIRARPASGPEKMLKWIKRQPALAALFAVIALAVVAFLVIGVWSYRNVQAARDRAEARYQLARKVVDDFYVKFAEEHLAEAPHQGSMQRQFLEKALKLYLQFSKEKGGDAEARREAALAWFRVAQIRRIFNEYEDSKPAFDRAIAAQEKLLAADPHSEALQQDLANSLNWRGEMFRLNDKPALAAKDYLRAQELQTDLTNRFPQHDQNWSTLARSHYNLGNLQSNRGEFEKGKENFDRAIEYLDRLHRDRPGAVDYAYELAVAHINRGVLHKRKNESSEAEADYCKAIELLKPHAGQDSKSVCRRELAVSYQNLGNLLAAKKNDKKFAQEAEVVLQAAVDLLKDLARSFPNRAGFKKKLANTYNSLGSLWFNVGRRKEAVEQWRNGEAVLFELEQSVRKEAIFQERLGLIRGNLGLAAFVEKDYAAARELFLQAAAHLQSARKSDPENIAVQKLLRTQQRNLAEVCIQLGDHRRAADAAQAMAKLFPNQALDSYYAACFLARCIPLVEKTKATKSLAERKKRKTIYADGAIAALQQAVAVRNGELPRLANEKEIFAVLRDHPQYRHAIEKLNTDN